MALWRVLLGHRIMRSFNRSISFCRYLWKRGKILIFKSLVLPVLIYEWETWTVNSELKGGLITLVIPTYTDLRGIAEMTFVIPAIIP